ncbi:MAG: putative ABC transport system ATP-binding protein [Oleiphilaceae bacterium]|jgi:putative ABC transport system ATP-binding protein
MDNNKILLKVENLRFRWPSSQRDVIDISNLAIQQGERVFIKGESGSGKTTLLSLLGGINLPDTGRIELLGTDISQLKQSRRDQFRADHIGFIFQLFNLIPYLSVIENITLACEFSSSRKARALLQSNSLEKEAYRLLSHLQLHDRSILNKPVSDLSVGQQQRVAVARALIGSPEIIIADEPTSALDTDTREHFLQLLLRECERSGSSVLFVSHDSSLEGAFDRSISLSDVNKAGIAVNEYSQEAIS